MIYILLRFQSLISLCKCTFMTQRWMKIGATALSGASSSTICGQRQRIAPKTALNSHQCAQILHKYKNTTIQIHKYTNIQTHKYTNTQIQHMTKCQKDPTCAIFLKRGLFKDIKNDISMCQTRKYKNTNTQIHKYSI